MMTALSGETQPTLNLGGRHTRKMLPAKELQNRGIEETQPKKTTKDP
jgi:hypothetical protein